ncbi:hypothetical protein ACUOFC_41020, partial [Escherichia sp. TWPC-MK]
MPLHHYFENDQNGSHHKIIQPVYLFSSVILNIKRSSAAYHSRNLSEKVFIGQVNLIKLGYHQGGMAGYGLRRLLVD